MGKKYKYIILRISDDKKSIILDKTSTSEEYEQFLSDLPAGEPRWAVYDFQFEKEGAGRRNKILFYAWAPDEAPIKSKMLYSSSKDALRAKLVGIAFDIQCTDESERAYDTGTLAFYLNQYILTV